MESPYQSNYDKAKARESIGGVDEVNAEILSVQAELNSPDLSNSRKEYLRRKIKTLNIKKKSYVSGKPVEEAKKEVDEESQAGITTGSAGNVSSYGGAGNFAPKMGMVRRNGKDKKKKKKNEAWEYLNGLISETIGAEIEYDKKNNKKQFNKFMRR